MQISTGSFTIELPWHIHLGVFVLLFGSAEINTPLQTSEAKQVCLLFPLIQNLEMA